MIRQKQQQQPNEQACKPTEPETTKVDQRIKSYLSVVGTSLIFFSMGLYFAAGNTGVYLTSYLIYRSASDMKLDDSIWFLSAAGFSALLLPLGGWLEGKLGVRMVCIIGGSLQSLGIFATYYTLDTSFIWVVVSYGGAFLVSFTTCYTSPMVNLCRWHPQRKGLVTGIAAASMAMAPTLFTPLITEIVNPNNLPANNVGLFDDQDVLNRTKSSTIVQGIITSTLMALGIALTFPAHEEVDELTKKPNSLLDQSNNTPKLPPTDYSIEPRFVFRTSEFWLLSLKVLISYMIFVYLLFMYKPFGQTFIQDDYFLSSVGVACAISNTLGRLSMGHVKDQLGYRSVSILLSLASMIFVPSMILTSYLDSEILYGIAVVLSVGSVGSEYALMLSATQDSFGDRWASLNIGFVYMSSVVASVSSALLSQHLASLIGWQGMIVLIGLCGSINFATTFLLPSNPNERLIKRHRQFYLKLEENKV